MVDRMNLEMTFGCIKNLLTREEIAIVFSQQRKQKGDLSHILLVRLHRPEELLQIYSLQ